MTNQELDRLAAEKVMEYREAEDTWFDAEGWPVADWSPTTNESHAAMVRERMREDGWSLELRAHPRFHSVRWIFEKDRGQVGESRLGTPSVAYAITTAALLAVGAVTEEELSNGR